MISLIFVISCITTSLFGNYILEGQGYYTKQKSSPSNKKTLGWTYGLYFKEALKINNVYINGEFQFLLGDLSGEDIFGDYLKMGYFEYDIDFHFSSIYKLKRIMLEPFVGYGYRYITNKNKTLEESTIETRYQYVPIGILLYAQVSKATLLMLEGRTDIMTVTGWKYYHPAICIEQSSLIHEPSYEANASLAYRYSCRCRWLVKAIYRYINLRYSQEFQYAPEEKLFEFYGIRVGFSFLF